MTGQAAGGPQLETGWLDRFLEGHRDELIAFRRHLHEHPELSGQEVETTEAVFERLAVSGLSGRVLGSGTGLLCDIGADVSGPIVALRADLDALAMHDDKDVIYRSRRPGVAHACGHDVHTTVVLGAGLALAQLAERGDLAGQVRLVFEPAEETVPGGAVEVIAAGGLDGVGSMLGLHCDPKVDLGTVSVRGGPITSAADTVTIQLTGPGGHTARPERTIDLVAVAGRVAAEVPGIVRDLAAPGILQVVFGALHAGDAPNVIPTRAELRGSVRAPEHEIWEKASELLTDAVAHVVGPTGAAWEIDHRHGVPPVVNDPDVNASIAAAARLVLGPGGVGQAEHSRGGDSYAWYGQRVPAAYARLGTHDPADTGARLDLHSGAFDVDERCIEIGVRVLVEAALIELGRLARTDDGSV